jgi:hypothetical protein
MPKSQKQALAVGGIQVNVFSPFPDPGRVTSQVAILFLLHGRLSKADSLEATATRLVENSEDRRGTNQGGATLSLAVVTFVSGIVQRHARDMPGGQYRTWCAQDLRNHGTRIIDPQGNQQWSREAEKNNPRHA